MINIRGIPKKKFEKPQKSRMNNSRVGKGNSTPSELDRSLLIHDDQDDIISDQSTSLKEINDKDIPLEKRNIINDHGYFKQLSLSFYGESLSPSRSVRSITKPENNQYNFKTGSSHLNTSLSPRSTKEYYYGLRKSPTLAFEKDPFQMRMSSLAQKGQKSQNSLSNSKLNLSQTRDKYMDKYEPKSPRNVARIELKDLKAFKVNLNSVLTTQVKNIDGKGMYPQFGTTGQTTCSSTTPRYSNFWEKDLIKEIHPNIKKTTNTKAKAATKEYLLTEPNTSTIKSPNSARTVPKKLKMYALDNFNPVNFKVTMGSDGKIQSNRSGVAEKASMRPSMSRGAQGVSSNKKPGMMTSRKAQKNSSYYD